MVPEHGVVIFGLILLSTYARFELGWHVDNINGLTPNVGLDLTQNATSYPLGQFLVLRVVR